MPNLIITDPTAVYSNSDDFAVGTVASDKDGKEYIFLKGVASTAAGDWVTYNSSFETARSGANSAGPVAVAKAAIVANKYGWYQIRGWVTANTGATATATYGVYWHATAGTVSSTGVAGDWVQGATVGGTTITGASSGTFFIDRPMSYGANSAYLT